MESNALALAAMDALNCFIVRSHINDKLGYAIGASNWICCVIDRLYSCEELMDMSGLSIEELPLVSFVMDDQSWRNTRTQERFVTPPRDVIKSSIVAKCIVEAVNQYCLHALCNNPSITEPTELLDKQFPRNDLYIFEFLLRALDRDANQIKVMLHTNIARTEYEQQPGLLLLHNGQPLSALDVLDMSSLGIHSQLNGHPRTIGFMGLGFKAVYKRFKKVMVYDEMYSFGYSDSVSDSNLRSAWMLQPHWISPEAGASKWDDNRISETRTWTHIQCQDPRPSHRPFFNDLDELPRTVPVILGRTSLLHAFNNAKSLEPFALDWGNIRYDVRGISNAKPFSYVLFSGENGSLVTVEDITLDTMVTEGSISESSSDYKPTIISDRSVKSKWKAISVWFVPDYDAQRVLETRTRKLWNQQTAWKRSNKDEVAGLREECCILFRCTDEDEPCPAESDRTLGGCIHATIPTKLRLPCPLHFQASWLLSIDRQTIQEIFGMAWNRCILQQLQLLLSGVLVLAANVKAQAVESFYALLPPFELKYSPSANASIVPVSFTDLDCTKDPRSNVELHTKVFDIPLQMKAISQAIRSREIVPVSAIAEVMQQDYQDCFRCPLNTHYVSAANAVWLPRSLCDWVHPVVWHQLFDAWPVSSSIAEIGSAKNLWYFLPKIDVEKLAKKTHRLLELSMSYSLETRTQCDFAQSQPSLAMQIKYALTLRILRAISECKSEKPFSVQDLPPVPAPTNQTDTLCGGWLPSVRLFCIFPTVLNELVSYQDLVWFDFGELRGLNRKSREVLFPVALHVRTKAEEIRLKGKVKAKAKIEINFHLLDFDLLAFFETAINQSGEKSSGTEYPIMPVTNERIEAAIAIQPSRLKEIKKERQKYFETLSNGDLNRAAEYFVALTATMPNNQVHIDECVAFYLHRLSKQSSLNSIEVDQVLDLFSWALTNNKPPAIEFVLVDTWSQRFKSTRNESQRSWTLMHVSKVLIGSDYDPTSQIESAMQSINCLDHHSALMFVSTIYLSKLSFSSSQVNQFLKSCGVQNGFSLSPTMMIWNVEKSKLRLGDRMPTLRGSTPSAAIYLPYNLGVMSRLNINHVDAVISDPWKLLVNLAKYGRDLAEFVSNAVGQVLPNVDAASVATASTTPCAGPALLGKSPWTPSEIAALASRGIEYHGQGFASVQNSITKLIPLASPYPVYSRAYFLPSGQPGASTINIDVCSWIEILADAAWIPASEPGSESGRSPVTMVVSPKEVYLQQLDQRLQRHAKGETIDTLITDVPHLLSSSELATPQLPPRLLEIFAYAPTAILKRWAWGTIKCRSMLPKFHRGSELAASFMQESKLERTARLDGNHPSIHLLMLWNEFYSTGSGKVDKVTNFDMFGTSIKKSYLIPTRNLEVVQSHQCVYTSQNPDSISTAAAVVLSSTGYLVNIRAEFCALQEMACSLGLVTTAVSGEEIAACVADALHIPSAISLEQAASFLRWTADAEPSTVTKELKAAFSYCLWMVIKSIADAKLGKDFTLQDAKSFQTENSTAAIGVIRNKIVSSLLEIVPNLKLYCLAGADSRLGPSTADWVPYNLACYRIVKDSHPHKSTAPTPVLIEPTECIFEAELMLSVIRTQQPIQQLGILTNFTKDADSAPATVSDNHFLAILDRALIDILGIYRVPDFAMIKWKPSIGHPSPVVSKETDHLRIILFILLIIAWPTSSHASFARIQTQLIARVELATVVIKCPNISAEYQLPTMQEPDMVSLFAYYGLYSRLLVNDLISSAHRQVIFISGDKANYVSELMKIARSYWYYALMTFNASADDENAISDLLRGLGTSSPFAESLAGSDPSSAIVQRLQSAILSITFIDNSEALGSYLKRNFNDVFERVYRYALGAEQNSELSPIVAALCRTLGAAGMISNSNASASSLPYVSSVSSSTVSLFTPSHTNSGFPPSEITHSHPSVRSPSRFSAAIVDAGLMSEEIKHKRSYSEALVGAPNSAEIANRPVFRQHRLHEPSEDANNSKKRGLSTIDSDRYRRPRIENDEKEEGECSDDDSSNSSSSIATEQESISSFQLDAAANFALKQLLVNSTLSDALSSGILPSGSRLAIEARGQLMGLLLQEVLNRHPSANQTMVDLLMNANPSLATLFLSALESCDASVTGAPQWRGLIAWLQTKSIAHSS